MIDISVEFEVFKELTVRRRSEDMTENDVLRELLELPKKPHGNTRSTNEDRVPWVSKGVTFPHGTQFRATYKGQQYTAVIDDGALVMNGKRVTSLSAAAISISGNSVNGWRFWECLPPGTTKWKLAADLR